jgi:hypothetical protein
MNHTKPLFDTNAAKTISTVSATFSQRGGEYGDTWRDCQWLNMKAVAFIAGLKIDTAQCRLLAAAALSDVKYQRMQGGYKADTVIDRIAYDANLAAEVDNFMATTPLE